MTNYKVQLNESDLALCRSALYEAVALGFRPPTQETMHRLLTENHNQGLAEIAAILDQATEVKSKNDLSKLVIQLLRCSDIQSLETLEISYRKYFGHTTRSTVPLYETEYGEETLFQQPQQLGDIAGFYQAFGLQLNLNEHERLDHISCESEFLSFLTRKEVYAVEQNDLGMLDETHKAQKLFLRDHFGRFAPSFSQLLIRVDSDGFYGGLAKLCYEFVLRECQRYGVTPGPEQLRLRPKVFLDECFTCGSGEELIKNIK